MIATLSFIKFWAPIHGRGFGAVAGPDGRLRRSATTQCSMRMGSPITDDKLSACVILAEIGRDMSRFPTAGHLISWAGLCPKNDESAGKRGERGRNSRSDGRRYCRTD
jgi:hypothetical protein